MTNSLWCQCLHLNAENFPWKICSRLHSYNHETCDESDFGKHSI
jgi:hypothetical protein